MLSQISEINEARERELIENIKIALVSLSQSLDEMQLIIQQLSTHQSSRSINYSAIINNCMHLTSLLQCMKGSAIKSKYPNDFNEIKPLINKLLLSACGIYHYSLEYLKNNSENETALELKRTHVKLIFSPLVNIMGHLPNLIFYLCHDKHSRDRAFIDTGFTHNFSIPFEDQTIIAHLLKWSDQLRIWTTRPLMLTFNYSQEMTIEQAFAELENFLASYNNRLLNKQMLILLNLYCRPLSEKAYNQLKSRYITSIAQLDFESIEVGRTGEATSAAASSSSDATPASARASSNADATPAPAASSRDVSVPASSNSILPLKNKLVSSYIASLKLLLTTKYAEIIEGILVFYKNNSHEQHENYLVYMAHKLMNKIRFINEQCTYSENHNNNRLDSILLLIEVFENSSKEASQHETLLMFYKDLAVVCFFLKKLYDLYLSSTNLTPTLLSNFHKAADKLARIFLERMDLFEKFFLFKYKDLSPVLKSKITEINFNAFVRNSYSMYSEINTCLSYKVAFYGFQPITEDDLWLKAQRKLYNIVLFQHSGIDNNLLNYCGENLSQFEQAILEPFDTIEISLLEIQNQIKMSLLVQESAIESIRAQQKIIDKALLKLAKKFKESSIFDFKNNYYLIIKFAEQLEGILQKTQEIIRFLDAPVKKTSTLKAKERLLQQAQRKTCRDSFAAVYSDAIQLLVIFQANGAGILKIKGESLDDIVIKHMTYFDSLKSVDNSLSSQATGSKQAINDDLGYETVYQELLKEIAENEARDAEEAKLKQQARKPQPGSADYAVHEDEPDSIDVATGAAASQSCSKDEVAEESVADETVSEISDFFSKAAMRIIPSAKATVSDLNEVKESLERKIIELKAATSSRNDILIASVQCQALLIDVHKRIFDLQPKEWVNHIPGTKSKKPRKVLSIQNINSLNEALEAALVAQAYYEEAATLLDTMSKTQKDKLALCANQICFQLQAVQQEILRFKVKNEFWLQKSTQRFAQLSQKRAQRMSEMGASWYENAKARADGISKASQEYQQFKQSIQLAEKTYAATNKVYENSCPVKSVFLYLMPSKTQANSNADENNTEVESFCVRLLLLPEKKSSIIREAQLQIEHQHDGRLKNLPLPQSTLSQKALTAGGAAGESPMSYSSRNSSSCSSSCTSAASSSSSSTSSLVTKSERGVSLTGSGVGFAYAGGQAASIKTPEMDDKTTAEQTAKMKVGYSP